MFLKRMKNSDEQIERCDISFHTYHTYIHTYLSYFFEAEVNKELKKNNVRTKDNIGFKIPFCRETINVFSHITFLSYNFCHIIVVI